MKAGLKPIDALKAATLNPAVYLGIQRDHGTVQVGKVADLVLLRANPLDDIHNTTKIESVVLGGRLLSRKELDKLMPRNPKVATARHDQIRLGALADDETPF